MLPAKMRHCFQLHLYFFQEVEKLAINKLK